MTSAPEVCRGLICSDFINIAIFGRIKINVIKSLLVPSGQNVQIGIDCFSYHLTQPNPFAMQIVFDVYCPLW